ncbi:MAG: helix-turn-helix domain-containing protein [Bacteroidota bacterium]
MQHPTEQFTSIQPHHPLLRQHIAYYYFHQTFDDHFRKTFTYYPNYRIALNVFQHATIQWNNQKRFTLPDRQKAQSAILTFSTQKSREVAMQGCVHKIGIIFEPMGFNHFIDVPLQQLIPDTINHFDYYGPTFWEMTAAVFATPSLIEKRNLLDAFFLSHFQPFILEELTLITNEIMHNGGSISVARTAKNLGVSRKTLLRLFQKHMAHNIRGFSNLVRFRKALQLYKAQKGQLNLTQLAYAGQYYDQSDFIKNIQAFTGLTPKQLFYQLPDIGGEHTFWTTKT